MVPSYSWSEYGGNDVRYSQGEFRNDVRHSELRNARIAAEAWVKLAKSLSARAHVKRIGVGFGNKSCLQVQQAVKTAITLCKVQCCLFLLVSLSVFLAQDNNPSSSTRRQLFWT